MPAAACDAAYDHALYLVLSLAQGYKFKGRHQNTASVAAADHASHRSVSLQSAVQSSTASIASHARSKVGSVKSSKAVPLIVTAVASKSRLTLDAEKKWLNPYRAPEKHAPKPNRTWTVADLQRDDLLTFAVDITVQEPSLSEQFQDALQAATMLLERIHDQLQTVPIAQATRRAVLSDLFFNVYPLVVHELRMLCNASATASGVELLLSMIREERVEIIDGSNVLELARSVRYAMAPVSQLRIGDEPGGIASGPR